MNLARLTIFFLLLSNTSLAQINTLTSPTPFDKFVSLNKISWAAYVNDTITFDSYNLNQELYNRFLKGDIKISEPISRENLMTGNSIVYLDKKQLVQKSYPPGLSPDEMDPKKPQHRMDENSTAVNVQQILYVANGKLYSYIPWGSPRYSIYTRADKFIGTSEYFSAAINKKYNFRSSKRDKLTFLGTTKRQILINDIPRTDLLKQMYGANILDAMWNDLMKEKYDVINIRKQQKVILKNEKEFTHSKTISIPVYDSLGRIMGTKLYSEPLLPSNFHQIELSQKWYYNHRKNIMVSNITDVTLYFRNKGEVNDMIPAYKITFK